MNLLFGESFPFGFYILCWICFMVKIVPGLLTKTHLNESYPKILFGFGATD